MQIILYRTLCIPRCKFHFFNKSFFFNEEKIKVCTLCASATASIYVFQLRSVHTYRHSPPHRKNSAWYYFLQWTEFWCKWVHNPFNLLNWLKCFKCEHTICCHGTHFFICENNGLNFVTCEQFLILYDNQWCDYRTHWVVMSQSLLLLPVYEYREESVFSRVCQSACSHLQTSGQLAFEWKAFLLKLYKRLYL